MISDEQPIRLLLSAAAGWIIGVSAFGFLVWRFGFPETLGALLCVLAFGVACWIGVTKAGGGTGM